MKWHLAVVVLWVSAVLLVPASAHAVGDDEWQRCEPKPTLQGALYVAGSFPCALARRTIRKYLWGHPKSSYQRTGSTGCRFQSWPGYWEARCSRSDRNGEPGWADFKGNTRPKNLLLSEREALNAIDEALRYRFGRLYSNGIFHWGRCSKGPRQGIKVCRFSWWTIRGTVRGRARVRKEEFGTGWVTGAFNRKGRTWRIPRTGAGVKP